MENSKINRQEYKVVADCVLSMWLLNRLTDDEFFKFMAKLNDYAKTCGLRDEENS